MLDFFSRERIYSGGDPIEMVSSNDYANKAETGTAGESVGEAFDNLNDAHTVKPGEPIKPPPSQDGGIEPPDLDTVPAKPTGEKE